MSERRQVLVVTGGSRGIGAAVARMGARQGYAVCVNFRDRADAADAVVRAIEADGGTAIAVRADVGLEADVVHMFTEVDRALGPVTALVNNAGVVGGEGRVDESDPNRLADLWRINITSCFLCAREALVRMSTRHGGRGGTIVNVSSMSARSGGRDARVHYAASKGAINSFTVGLAKEVAAEGVRVNAVAPGLTDTDIHAEYGGSPRIERMARNNALRRAATPDECANAILWLLSPEASFVVGTILEVSGGA